MTYVENRCISESGGVISDILEVPNITFLLQILGKFGFGIGFVFWIKTISKKSKILCH